MGIEPQFGPLVQLERRLKDEASLNTSPPGERSASRAPYRLSPVQHAACNKHPASKSANELRQQQQLEPRNHAVPSGG